MKRVVVAVVMVLALALPVATVAARRVTACEQIGTPILRTDGFAPYWSGVGVYATGLVKGQAYGVWAYSEDEDGVGRGYAFGPSVIATRNGVATLYFDQVRADKHLWEVYVYTVPGTPASNWVAVCDVDV